MTRLERPYKLRQGANMLSSGAARLSRVPAGHLQVYSECFARLVRDTDDAVGGEPPPGVPAVRQSDRGRRTGRCGPHLGAMSVIDGSWPGHGRAAPDHLAAPVEAQQ